MLLDAHRRRLRRGIHRECMRPGVFERLRRRLRRLAPLATRTDDVHLGVVLQLAHVSARAHGDEDEDGDIDVVHDRRRLRRVCAGR
jgi:hypothetical protein